MSIKRMPLLAAALAAIALAVPAIAAADGTWTHDGKKLQKNAQIELTGWVGIEAPGVANFECVVHIGAKFTRSWGVGTGVKTGKGHVESYETTTNTCVGAGVLQGCTLQDDDATNLPWLLTAREADIQVNGKIELDQKFNANCPVSETQLEFASITLEPDNSLSITDLWVSGETEAGMQVYGKLQIVGVDSNTYGVHMPPPQEESVETEEEETEEGEEERLGAWFSSFIS